MYAVSVATNTPIAAGPDHQILAAMTGSPTSSQAPTILLSIPLALRSPNQYGTWFTADMIPLACISVRGRSARDSRTG